MRLKQYITILYRMVSLTMIAGPAQAQEPITMHGREYVLIDDMILPAQSPAGRTAASDTSEALWPQGIVPFEFREDITSEEQLLMLEGMDVWIGASSGVAFVPRTNELNYLLIGDATAEYSPCPTVNCSWVGMEVCDAGEDCPTLIHIQQWSQEFVVAHELCHALSFRHEQSRPDRDDWVQINWEHILENCGPDQDDPCDANFYIDDDVDTFGHPYDYESIMHYRACSFSTCESDCESDDLDCVTITTNDPEYQTVIGNWDELSYWDIEDMRSAYSTIQSVYVDPSSDDSLGSLRNPYLTLDEGLSDAATRIFIREGAYEISDGLIDQHKMMHAYQGSVLITPN